MMRQSRIASLPSTGHPAGIRMDVWTDAEYGLVIKTGGNTWTIPQHIILDHVADFVRRSKISAIEDAGNLELVGLKEER